MMTEAKAGSSKATNKGRLKRGRTTAPAKARATSDRYTPPTTKGKKSSPRWMGGLIIGLFVLGVLMIILNYANVLPGGVSNWWLLGAIGCIFSGLMVATSYN